MSRRRVTFPELAGIGATPHRWAHEILGVEPVWIVTSGDEQ
ncbi:MAG: hypothetical protein WBM90_10365 [Acidimicrobiia bacterium]